MARGLVLSILKKSCKKIVAQCTIGVRTVIALLLKKLLTKLTAMIYKKVRIGNMDGNKKMYNYVPTLESLEYSLPLVIVLFLKPLNSKLLMKKSIVSNSVN